MEIGWIKKWRQASDVYLVYSLVARWCCHDLDHRHGRHRSQHRPSRLSGLLASHLIEHIYLCSSVLLLEQVDTMNGDTGHRYWLYTLNLDPNQSTHGVFGDQPQTGRYRLSKCRDRWMENRSQVLDISSYIYISVAMQCSPEQSLLYLGPRSVLQTKTSWTLSKDLWTLILSWSLQKSPPWFSSRGLRPSGGKGPDSLPWGSFRSAAQCHGLRGEVERGLWRYKVCFWLVKVKGGDREQDDR